jgi:hypothetical protein
MSWGQATGAGMAAKLAAGTTARYEFEAMVHISTEHGPNVKLKAPCDCSYQLRAVLKVDVSTRGTEGTLAGHISFQGVEAQIPSCANWSKERVRLALNEWETHGVGFQIYPAGDVRLTKAVGDDEPELISVLRKAAWDLLQTHLSDTEVTAGSPWTTSRRFLYWPDTFVEGLDVAAATMHYAQDVEIGGRKLAVLEYKDVFSPADMPAYIETRTQANDFNGTTLVTGHAGVSLLWDPAGQRVVYLHRLRDIDNRLLSKYDSAEQTTSLGRFLMQEESTLRWLPETESEAWLANLHRYENSGEIAPHRVQAAEVESKYLSDIADRVPNGFERWRRAFCSGGYCFEISVGVPAGTQVADSNGTTALLLSGSGDHTVMVSIGPMLDLQGAHLTEQELLQQQTQRFVGNQLWFGRGAGEVVNFSNGSVYDRPAGFSDFTSKSRDLTSVRGQLVMVIGPYGRLVPVACAYSEDKPACSSVCQIVTQSVLIK